MRSSSASEVNRYLMLVSDGKAPTKMPLPRRECLPDEKMLLLAVSRLRDSVDFSKGVSYEPALYSLHMQYILAASSPSEISSAVFQKDVLTSLQKLITLYRYHVPTSDVVKEFAVEASAASGSTLYKSSLFRSPEEARRLAVLGLKENDTHHPDDLLKKFQQPISFDTLSNIYICRDPYCSLSALDNASAGKYAGSVMDVLFSVEQNLMATNQLTWVSFASGNLGLTLLRLHIILNMLQGIKPEEWPAIEIVLIDPRYREAIDDIAEGSRPDYHSLSERIVHEITVGALHQFAQFIALRSPEDSHVTITVCQSAKSFINHAKGRSNLALGTCYLECDDVWVPGGSCSEYHTDTAVPDYENLRKFVGQRAVNGRYLLVSKNDLEQSAEVKVGDLGPSVGKEVTESFSFQEPFRKK